MGKTFLGVLGAVPYLAEGIQFVKENPEKYTNECRCSLFLAITSG